MEFDLTETQRLFKRSAGELFATECPPQVVREMIESGNPYSETLWNKLVEQGWTGLIFSEDAGGLGLSLVELAVAFEEMGRALVPGEFLSTVALSGPLVERAGTPDHHSRYLQAISEGRSRATVALLEDSANWDIDAIKLQATETGEAVELTGKKLFVTDAEVADFIITPARSGSELLLAIVDRNSQGLAINPMPSIDGTRNLSEVVFDKVAVAKADILARGDRARQALQHAVDVATLALAAEMVGGMQWTLDAAVEYAKTRKQFGKPIGQFQAIQHHCANMLLMTESARSAVYYAAWVMASDEAESRLAVSIAKMYASDACREVGNLGVQVHGGIGFTWDEAVHFYYKRAKASEIMFGDATYHRERIARLVVDRASEPEKVSSTTGD